MATGTMILGDSIFGVTEESTEGTYVAPSATTDYFQPLEGISITPKKDLLERNTITSGIGDPLPRTGLRGVDLSVPLEFRASGTEGEGDDFDFDLFYHSMLGNRRQLTSRFTTGTSHTTTVLNGTSVSSSFAIGDTICILESGAYHVAVVTAVTSTTLTYSPAASGAPSDGVEVAKFTTYYGADSGHKPLSISAYWANEIRQAAIGCKVTGWSLESFETGALPSQTFTMEGLSFSEVDGAAPNTPAYDSEIPPTVLNACVIQDGTQIPVNTVTINLEQSLSFVKSTCSANGKIRSNVVDRKITGSINPYKDDTSVANFTGWNNDTPFSLFMSIYTPSTTSGEINLGSIVGIYMPSCFRTDYNVGNVDNVLTDQITFKATGGAAGTDNELYIGFI